MVLEVIKMVVNEYDGFFALNGAIIGGFLEAFLVTKFNPVFVEKHMLRLQNYPTFSQAASRSSKSGWFAPFSSFSVHT